jgi:hypothetical protein
MMGLHNKGDTQMEIGPVHSSTPLDQSVENWHKDVFPPLDQVTRPTIPTRDAAYYLNRKEQTLRTWACLENGPIRPIRIHGRLAWSVQAISELLNQGGDSRG